MVAMGPSATEIGRVSDALVGCGGDGGRGNSNPSRRNRHPVPRRRKSHAQPTDSRISCFF